MNGSNPTQNYSCLKTKVEGKQECALYKFYAPDVKYGK